MARKMVTFSSVTDDITGRVFQGVMGSGDEIDDVKSYRVTFELINESAHAMGDNTVTFTKEIDIHADTYGAITDFINGDSDRNLFSLILSIWKVPVSTGDALWEFITGGIIANLLSILGGKPKSGNSGTNSGSGNPYTGYVRAYAISKGWTGANGNKIADKGKMSQDVVIKFVTETGITVERFNAGDRIPE